MPQPLDWNVAPVTCERTVYVGTEGSMDAGSTLFALDAMSGEVRWTFDLDDRLYGAAPVIADQTLFLNSGHDILALE